MEQEKSVPVLATTAVLSKSESLPKGTPIVCGYSFEDDVVDFDKLFASYATTGFQATNFAKAIDIINGMVSFLLPVILPRYERIKADFSLLFTCLDSMETFPRAN